MGVHCSSGDGAGSGSLAVLFWFEVRCSFCEDFWHSGIECITFCAPNAARENSPAFVIRDD
ncbi:hypothetical protein CMUST_05700 [Corynebacterium mustelae]|uniref:Uncharacterized protein n=1 Tax=Corynebacterium mustelae TaxID=571915 RepID=A0A0G3GWB4_9CORY|nr:hypothetical protein CMUST_05700 [Corynebacterium mustelae]